MSTKDFGCFYCTGKSKERDGTCNQCNSLIDVETRLLDSKIGDYTPKSVLGRGFNGWTVLATDGIQDFAVKVVPLHRIPAGLALPDQREIAALRKCSSHRNIARFVRAIEATIEFSDRKIQAIAIAFEYIPSAKTLRKFIQSPPADIGRSDISEIVIGIASGLQRLDLQELWHDDLHDDNILVRIVEDDENLNARFEPKLIDFGSAKRKLPDQPEHGERSDYHYLSNHIYALARAFEKAKHSTFLPADREYVQKLRVIAQMIADPDVSRRNLKPKDVKELLERALLECANGNAFPPFDEMIKHRAESSLSGPLDKTNALSLFPQDIALLFRDSLRWESQLGKSETALVLGPRGCGKTMLFRYMSIATAARPVLGENSAADVSRRLKTLGHAGFIISAGQLRTPFLNAAYKAFQREAPEQAEDYCREYFNLYFGFEVARTVAWLAEEQLIDMTSEENVMLAQRLLELLDDKLLHRGLGLKAVSELLDRRASALSTLAAFSDYKPSQYGRDDALHQIAQTLRQTRWGTQREIWFLFDDYSVTVLPEFAQRAYNPVLFRLPSEARIKVSSEGAGPVVSDSLQRKYVVGREITRINLGEIYFNSSEDECVEFFETVLEARFQATKNGSLAALKTCLGSHPNSKNFGQYLLSKPRAGDARFFGFDIVCQLCSGDVSFIIELLGNLTQGGKLLASPTYIPDAEQDIIIKRFAQQQLNHLRTVSKFGIKLHEFAAQLGLYLRQTLLASKPGGRLDERLRVEVSGTMEFKDSNAHEMHEAPLRNSVLVYGGIGKDREGRPCERLYFRRLYAPCFPFSTRGRGTVAITIDKYEAWLLNPELITQGKLTKSPSTPKPTKPPKSSDPPGEQLF